MDNKQELTKRVLALGIKDASTRCWVPGVWPSNDGPVLGVTYSCDYRYEEESGVGELRQAILGKDPRNVDPVTHGHASMFVDCDALLLSSRTLASSYSWGDLVCGSDQYAQYFSDTVTYAQGSRTDLRWETVASLREMAETHDLARPWPRKKAELVQVLAAHLGATTPWQWPGWFHYGDALILRSDGGVASEVLAGLVEAVKENTLTISSTSGAFRSGLFICDSRDIGPKTRQDLVAKWDLHDKRMQPLETVRHELEKRGYGFYFLGRPTEMKDDGSLVVKYWLNGQTKGGVTKQPFGWYTLDELLDEKFVDDANAVKTAR